MAGNELELAAARIEIKPKQAENALKLIRAKGREIGDIAAFRQAGVKGTKGQIRASIEADEELQDAIAHARGRDPEVMRDEIKRRAIDGVERPVFWKGEVVGTVVEYSDKLLEMMARAHLPEYRDTSRVEHTGPGGGPVEVENPDVAAALDRFTTTIERLATRASESGGTVRAAEPARPALPAGKARR